MTIINKPLASRRLSNMLNPNFVMEDPEDELFTYSGRYV
jgi:hypothetical protein